MKYILCFSVLVYLCIISVSGEYVFIPPDHPERDPATWRARADNFLKVALNKVYSRKIAKNVILFVGSGMGQETVTAARIFKGSNEEDPDVLGEETSLDFEKFPFVGSLMTYSVDMQVTDEAAASIAIFTGVKGNNGMLGVSGKANKTDCSTVAANTLTTIVDWAQAAGKWTGLVTDVAVASGGAAGLYAKTIDSKWEYSVPPGKTCMDNAAQLMENTTGKNLRVIFGGGLRAFKGENAKVESMTGRRPDGQDLVNKWINDKQASRQSHVVLYDAKALRALNPTTADYVLGLFAEDDLPYHYEMTHSRHPKLSEMTGKAIQILSRNKKGYLLVVHAGLIGRGHRMNKAALALKEVEALEEAVQEARGKTSNADTLIVVLGNHASPMVINGFPFRGNPILGMGGILEDFERIYTTLMYTTGPGFRTLDTWPLPDEDTQDWNYIHMAGIDTPYSMNSGSDTPVYADGPMAYLFDGVHELHFVSHAMAYAACIGEYSRTCQENRIAPVEKKENGNKGDENKDGGNKGDENKDGGNKGDENKDGGNKDGRNKEDGKDDDGKDEGSDTPQANYLKGKKTTGEAARFSPPLSLVLFASLLPISGIVTTTSPY